MSPTNNLKKAFSFGTDPWDPSQRFETSWLIGPWALFACRFIIGIYILTVRLFVISWECTHTSAGGCQQAARDFSYFTVLTYWGLTFYFLTSAVHTYTYAVTARPLLDRFPRPLQALHSFYYTTIVTFPFLVTIVYWGVIYKGPWFVAKFDAWSNVSQHALNSAFALFEILIPRTSPPSWVHIPFLILILGGYLSVAYITQATQGWYPYNFLDYHKVGSRGGVAAYIVGIAVAIVVIFIIVRSLIWVRRWLTETWLAMNGKFAVGAWQGQNLDVEMNNLRYHQPSLSKDQVDTSITVVD